eukprot:1981457-Pleurochrysis_carterae.AAC.1
METSAMGSSAMGTSVVRTFARSILRLFPFTPALLGLFQVLRTFIADSTLRTLRANAHTYLSASTPRSLRITIT